VGIAARVGFAAGEPISDRDDRHGMVVVIASRPCSAAASGEVLVQDLVTLLVASCGAVSLEELKSNVLCPSRCARRALTGASWATVDRIGPGARAGDSEAASGAEWRASTRRRSLPRMLAADVDEPMIGREREVGLLREATSAKIRRRAVLVLGEKMRHATAAAVRDLIGEPLRVGGNSWLSELARARRAGRFSALLEELVYLVSIEVDVVERHDLAVADHPPLQAVRVGGGSRPFRVKLKIAEHQVLTRRG
jgi:hypothetical protein